MERSVRGGRASIVGLGVVSTLVAGGASAQEGGGVPADWQLGLQEPVTEVMERIVWFHNDFLMPIITVITVFVLGLLVYVMLRFNARSNPTPSRATHNTMLEVVWTVVPIVILVAIAVPSFRLLYFQQTIPEADLTIKATGHQWFWTYEYPEHDALTFDSLMLEDDELQEGQPRLLAVDNAVVVPVGKIVRVQVIADDVIHNWAVPAFGVKIDAVPGRLNETWFKADRVGVYYGQCSELCGLNHAFMPIEVRVVEDQEFAEWLTKAKQEFASNGPAVGGRDAKLAAAAVAIGE